jgi:hypothetical protein
MRLLSFSKVVPDVALKHNACSRRRQVASSEERVGKFLKRHLENGSIRSSFVQSALDGMQRFTVHATPKVGVRGPLSLDGYYSNYSTLHLTNK